MKIKLTKGRETIVDASDYKYLSKYKWYALPRSKGGFYAVRRKGIKMSKAIMKPPKGLFVDHINGDGLDNRRCNLRLATSSQNNANKHGSCKPKSGFYGVYKVGKKWQALYSENRKTHHLSMHDTPEEAALARDLKTRRIYGEFARLNYPKVIKFLMDNLYKGE